MKKLLIVILIITISCCKYTQYKQCDDEWGYKNLGHSQVETICSKGSSITCLGMILDTLQITLDGNNATPYFVNKWLTNNSGYINQDQLIWSAISVRGLTYKGQYGATLANSFFDQGYHIILNVLAGTHYVLMTGHTGQDTLNVNDPLYDKAIYSIQDVVAIQIYNPYKPSLEQIIKARKQN